MKHGPKLTVSAYQMSCRVIDPGIFRSANVSNYRMAEGPFLAQNAENRYVVRWTIIQIATGSYVRTPAFEVSSSGRPLRAHITISLSDQVLCKQ